MNTLEQQRVVDEALSWVGTPWRHAARQKGHGVDCGQLLIAVYGAAGMVGMVPVDQYPQDWALHRSEEKFLSIVERYAVKVVGAVEPGDVALFRYGRCLSHAAIVIAWPKVVHAYIQAREVVLDDVAVNADLQARLVGYWRYNGG